MTTLVVAVIIIWLLQALIVPVFLRGVGGSFGLRPQTHGCIGISLGPNVIHWLPKGDVEFRVLVHVRNHIPAKFSGERFCLGQDIWFGEEELGDGGARQEQPKAPTADAHPVTGK